MDHVIIGAGPAGVVAAETLRHCDPEGRVTIVGDEPEPPYSRMAIPYFLSGPSLCGSLDRTRAKNAASS